MSINLIGNNKSVNLNDKQIKSFSENAITNKFLINDKNKGDTFNFSVPKNVNDYKKELDKIKSQQGLIGKFWDGFKNLTGIGASSCKAQKAIENYELGLISKEKMQQSIQGYKEGQKTVVDVVADIASGILSVGAFALIVPTGGASLPLGLGIATATGALSKIAIKASDAIFTDKEYKNKDLLYDIATGGLNGLLAPITNGIGNSVTKTIASKVIKEGTQEALEQTAKQSFGQIVKNIILNQSDDIIGGTIKQRALALGSGMAIDGALGGAGDNMLRAGLNGENILKAGAEGFVGGLIMSPIIGGGFRLINKAGSKLGKKIINNESELTKTVPINLKANIQIDSVQGYIDFARNLNTSAGRDFADAIEKAIKQNKIEVLNLQRLAEVAQLLDSESLTSQQLKALSSQFQEFITQENGNFTKNAGQEIMEALGISGELIQEKGKNTLVYNDDSVRISARAKGADSIFSKARNKILGLKAQIPENLEALKPLIADAQGVRMVINSAKELDIDSIKKYVSNDLSEVELDDFLKYIQNKAQFDENKTLKFKKAETKILRAINDEQVDNFVENFSKAIEQGKIRVTELHNYSSKDGIPYLNQKHVDKIQEAYKSWYKEQLDLAKRGIGEYKLGKDKNNLEVIIDKQGNEFYKSMLIESISDNNEKAMKNNGYTAVQFNMISSQGQLMEFQYRGLELDEIAQCEHIIYDIRKNKDTVLGEEYDEVRKVLAKFSRDEKIMSEYDRYYNDVFKAYRKRELGINARMPNIDEYPLLKKQLSPQELRLIDVNGIIALHNRIEANK